MRVRVTRSSSGTATSDLDFTLTLTNPCGSRTLDVSGVTINNVTLKVGETNTANTFTTVPDSAGNTSLCGTRTYSILTSADAAAPAWISITGSGPYTISINPNNDSYANASAYSLKLKVVLQAPFASISAEKAFTVTINAYVCTSATVYTAASSVSAKTYTIGATAVTFQTPSFTTPYTCSETYTYEMRLQATNTATSAYGSVDASGLVTISTSDGVNLSSGVIGLRIAVSRSSAGTTTSYVDFALTLTNPCTSATFDMSGFSTAAVSVVVGSSVTKTFTEIPDSTGNLSLCGSRTYQVRDSQGLAVSWASISGPASGTYTITFNPATNSMYSSSPYSVRLHVSLASHTAVATYSSAFNVNVSQYVCGAGTTYTASGSIADKSYIIRDTALTFTAPSFTTSPYTCSETITYAL